VVAIWLTRRSTAATASRDEINGGSGVGFRHRA
jgi:hypothetical protein